jgi:hypothetical protein
MTVTAVRTRRVLRTIGTPWRIAFRAAAAAGVMGMMMACKAPRSASDVRLWTKSYELRVSSDPIKPVSEFETRYKIVVKDKETGQPVSGGEGRLFATNRQGASTDDGFAVGPEVGTYYATLRFPGSGDWAFGIQFRRDSTAELERTDDWMQTILPAPPLGSELKHDTAADTAGSH